MTAKDAGKFEKTYKEIDVYVCEVTLSFFGKEQEILSMIKGRDL